MSEYFTAFVILFTTIVLCIFIVLRRRFTYWRRHGVKGANYQKVQNFFKPFHVSMMADARQYGRVFGIYFWEEELLVVNEPELIRDILVKDSHVFYDHPSFMFRKCILAHTISFGLVGADWKRVRSIISPAFTTDKIKSMMRHMLNISDRLGNVLTEYEGKGYINMHKYLMAYVIQVRAQCLFGVNIDLVNSPDDLLVKNHRLHDLRDVNLATFVYLQVTELATQWLGLEYFDSDFIAFYEKFIREIVDKRIQMNKVVESGRNAEKSIDFIQLLIDSHNSDRDGNVSRDGEKGSKSISTDELIGQCMLFFVNLSDAYTMTHVLYYLSQNSECQQRLYDELKNITDFSYEVLNGLQYLNAVISETLRLAPPLSVIERECSQDYKLGNTGITISKGTAVQIIPYVVHRDPEFWPNPEQFKPERFIDAKHTPYAYIPYSAGHHICVGQKFAQIEMRLCLAQLVRQFRFTLMPGFVPDYYNGKILFSPKQMMLGVKSRDRM